MQIKHCVTFGNSQNIPFLNIIPENSFPGFPKLLSNRCRKLKEELGDPMDNVTKILAKGSGYAVFQDNPALIINAIIKAYSKALDERQQNDFLQRALDNAMEACLLSGN